MELSGPATLESTAGRYECRTSGADPPAHLTWTLLDRTGADLTHLLQVESGEHTIPDIRFVSSYIARL